MIQISSNDYNKVLSKRFTNFLVVSEVKGQFSLMLTYEIL